MFREIGTIKIDRVVDITDPSYDKRDSGKIVDLEMKNGNYQCLLEIDRIDYKLPDGTRKINEFIESLIVTQNTKAEWHYLETVAVDSALIGLFIDKPDFNNAEWQDFIDTTIGNEPFYLDGTCFFANFHDGIYEVYRQVDNNNEVIGIKIT